MLYIIYDTRNSNNKVVQIEHWHGDFHLMIPPRTLESYESTAFLTYGQEDLRDIIVNAPGDKYLVMTTGDPHSITDVERRYSADTVDADLRTIRLDYAFRAAVVEHSIDQQQSQP